MNTSLWEAFALWFYMTWRSMLVYFIVFTIYVLLDWKIEATGNLFVNLFLKWFYLFTIITFFGSQIYFLKNGIEEYYKQDL